SGPSAQGYDIKIIGHTDTQVVRQIKGRDFKDNWELSAFRSISVMHEFTHMGVEPGRIEIAGRGEFQPAVANMAKGNTPQNRRVEIFLVRGSGFHSAPSNTATTPSKSPKKANASEDDLMK